MATDIAILAGWFFWCVESIFNDLKGVLSVESGYTGGRVANPTYRQVCDGDTGHAEAVRVEFDPDIISYDDILDIFLHIHDPTQLNRQGNDVGTQYRSAIFPNSPEKEDEASAANERNQTDWPQPIGNTDETIERSVTTTTEIQSLMRN